MINETYSAFVQGFATNVGRPDVDVLEGSPPRSSSTRSASAPTRDLPSVPSPMSARCRVNLFSRLGTPHIGSSQALLVQHSVDIRGRRGQLLKGGGREGQRTTDFASWACARALRRHGQSIRLQPERPVRREEQIHQRGRHHHSGYTVDGWYRHLRGGGIFSADKPIKRFTKKELDALPQGGDPHQGRRHQRHLRGPDPTHSEVDVVQGSRAMQPHIRGIPSTRAITFKPVRTA